MSEFLIEGELPLHRAAIEAFMRDVASGGSDLFGDDFAYLRGYLGYTPDTYVIVTGEYEFHISRPDLDGAGGGIVLSVTTTGASQKPGQDVTGQFMHLGLDKAFNTIRESISRPLDRFRYAPKSSKIDSDKWPIAAATKMLVPPDVTWAEVEAAGGYPPIYTHYKTLEGSVSGYCGAMIDAFQQYFIIPLGASIDAWCTYSVVLGAGLSAESS